MQALPTTPCRSLFLSAALAFGVVAASTFSHAAGAGFSVSKTSHGVTVTYGGQPFAEYVIDEANKPYLFPVFGPTGKLMTRSFPMKKVEGEQTDHYHHRGICFGHQDINGFDSWAERGSVTQVNRNEIALVPDDKLTDKQKAAIAKMGVTKHVAFKEVAAEADKAIIVEQNEYIGGDGKKSATEIRRITFRVEGTTRLIDWDQEFTATEGEVTFGDKKDAGLSIRVPSSMAVDSKKGGQIVTSTGITDKDAWGKRADWVDYHGPVDGETLGVAMLDHPTSFRHPTSWHVRTYGLFTANPFGTLDKADPVPNGPHTIKPGEKLLLRHRFLFHTGDEKSANIAAAYERYAKEK